ncbi:zinc finger protein 792-like [Bacillus rossius redtenbacheri]|uniref:zinc finger protein 792-like n=1 Tax=Bacillus rossius redtenbacheri TaxID=93214 RepID=UPI002FDC95E7
MLNMGSLKLCRLCALERECFVKIYEDEGQKLNLATKITQCLQIWLYPEDPLPKLVCMDCCSKLNHYFDFFETTSRAQLSLQVMFDRKAPGQEPKKELEGEQPAARPAESSPRPARAPPVIEAAPGEATGPPEFLECVLADKEAAANQNGADGSSRRKRRVPVKRMQRAGARRRERAKAERKGKERERRDRQEEAELQQQALLQVKEEEVKQEGPTGDAEADASFPDDCAEDLLDELGDAWDDGPGPEEEEAKPAGKPKPVLDGYVWQCTNCPGVLPTLQELRVHHHTQHNQPPNFKCVQCAKVYTRYRSFARHVKLHRNPKKFRCEECGKCFSQKTVLQSHSTVHTDARPHVCPQCGKAFKQFSSLYLHSKCHLPDQAKPKFPCDICNKDFATKHTLETHRKIHTGERNFICDICGKSFIAKGSLDYHILTHSGEKPHHCPVCGKGFKTARLLGKHATLHTGIKPHQCDVCGKQFRERGALREHNRIHTGAMPYTCEFCGKNFRFKGILTVHRRQHTGERPYACTDCRREFTNWANYNKHMKRRHRGDADGAAGGARAAARAAYQPPAPGAVLRQQLEASVYLQHPGDGGVYAPHLAPGHVSAAAKVFHGPPPPPKMAVSLGAVYQDNGQDSERAAGLVGSYHVPQYTPSGLPMGSMGYYIPPIQHSDQGPMDILPHRMGANQ